MVRHVPGCEARREEMTTPPDHPHWIKFYVDGGLLMAGRGTRKTRGVYWSMLCENPEWENGVLIRKQDFKYRTNNDAEWLALKEALQFAHDQNMGGMPIIIYSDSQLVVNQFNDVWRSKITRLHRLRTECKLLAEDFRFVIVQWVPRQVNVDKLGH